MLLNRKYFVSKINGKFYINNKKVPESHVKMLSVKGKLINSYIVNEVESVNQFGGSEVR